MRALELKNGGLRAPIRPLMEAIAVPGEVSFQPTSSSYPHSVTIFLQILLTHSNETDLEFQSERAYRAVK